MTVEPREPSRLPVRGTIAAAGTIGALTLLLSFRGGPLASPEPVTAANDDTTATDELVAAAVVTEAAAADAAIGPVTYTGDTYATRWGDVQVAVTLEGADITEVVALQLPSGDRHTNDISDYVEPVLREEAITSDSADVSVISGATYTSEAYAASLQSALDQADPAPAEEGPTSVDESAAVAEASPEAVAEEATTDEIRTATGVAVAIPWGDVQVAITVDGNDIIDVETLAIPTGDRHSQRINTTAEPILREEAIASDSADVAVVSGATYTSEAYASSLQSALDQLGI
jgi:uncharacterized protein with FMN-binding domain